MKKGIILSMACLALLCGRGKTPKLQDGKEAVVTFAKGETSHQISAEDLYNELKNNFGLEATVKLIDKYIFETEFADYIEDAKDTAESYIQGYVDAYGDRDKLLEAIKQNTNYTTIEGYQDYIYLNVMQSHALEEYAKTLVTEKEINNYYKDEVKGDIELYNILITPKVTDDMTDDEKKAAEDKAKETVKDIIKKLDNASDKLEEFKKLVKQYSEDESSKEKDGSLGFINYGVLTSNYDELLNAGYKLKDGEYSKSVITTELGYHVVYRNASKEKDKLEDIKEDIIKTLANEKIQESSTISVDSIKYYRKMYNMDIKDSTLNRQYGIYMNNLANQSTNTNN